MLARIPGGILVALERVETWLALVFGVCFSISFYCFVLIDYLPRTGNRILTLTGLALFIGVVGGYFVIRRIRETLALLSAPRRCSVLGSGLLLVILLFFAGTRFWQEPHRYPAFLIPTQNVTLEVLTDLSQPDGQVSLIWVTTSLGEISFDTASYQGWQRQDDQLVLTDGIENSFTWRGKTDDKLIFVIRSTKAGTARITVNGSVTETPLIHSGVDDQTITLPVSIPFFASRMAAYLSALIVLWVPSLVLVLFLASRENQFVQSFQNSFRQFSLLGTLAVPLQAFPFMRWEIWVILGVILFALLLRVFNLDNLYPNVDEYFQPARRKSILKGEPILSVYRRSLFTVTLPVAASFKLFGMNFWVARLPGAIVNSLAIWPLYLSLRKMNRPIAVIAGLLFATNPWMVSVARQTREYAYYPFIFFWIVYAMLTVLEHMPNGIVLDRRFWKQISWRWVTPLLFLAIPAMYAWTFDRLSTLKVVLVVYAVFALFVLGKLDFVSKINPLLLRIFSAVIIAIALFLLDWLGYIGLSLDQAARPVSLFIQNPPQQWYYGRLSLVPMLAVVSAIVVAIQSRRYSIVPLFFVSLLSAFLIFFSFFLAHDFRTRYIISVQFWYIVVMAFGLYLLWLLIKIWLPGRNLRLGLAVLLAVVSFNPMQTLLPTEYSMHQCHPISADCFQYFKNVHTYMLEHVQPTDALIYTVYGKYVQFVDAPTFIATAHYDHTNPEIDLVVEDFMNKNPYGWIVIDNPRYEASISPLPPNTSHIGDAQVEYLGMIDEQHVWHWVTPDD